MKKVLSTGLLVSYVVVLIWLVMFKLTFDISYLQNYQYRSLNLVPFAAPSVINGRVNYGEVVLNCIFFIPFGLLLNVNFKKIGFLLKLALIFAFSVTVELLQFIYAIGATDITDVLANTFGGLIGLSLYSVSNKFIRSERLDNVVISVGAFLLIVFVSVYFSHFVRFQ